METAELPQDDSRENAVVLFDGQCHLCKRAVRFIIKRDPKAWFLFAPLQSRAGEEILKSTGLPDGEDLDTVILVEGAEAYVKSDAALRIARRLSGPWPLLGVLTLVPRFIRHWVYDRVARRRHKWFGRSDSCMIPSKDVRDRFLSD